VTPAYVFAILLLLAVACYLLLIGYYTIGLAAHHQVFPHRLGEAILKVSVIIPVRNEEKQIDRLLAEMLAQDYPPGFFEVIVTDDFSADLTIHKVAAFAACNPGIRVRPISPGAAAESLQGKKSAIERAVAAAEGEVLLFTDADTSRGPAWISSMVSGFHKHGIAMVLGPVSYVNAHNLLQRIQQMEFLGLMGTTAGSAHRGTPVMCNGANLAYRRETFFKAGGFCEHRRYASGDDQFMMAAVSKIFGKGSVVFNFDPGSVVTTESESTLRGFVNQRLRWVSKSKGYRDPVVIGVGAITYLTHLMLLAGIVSGVFYHPLLFVSLALWMFKMSAEFPMVWIMGRFFSVQPGVGYYLMAQLFQLFYVPLIGILGQVLPYRWKGRKG
jgi:cellulose synthase/poly-beta-1,6-N-acetylglucosamine synthase-like glycosyltransferase